MEPKVKEYPLADIILQTSRCPQFKNPMSVRTSCKRRLSINHSPQPSKSTNIWMESGCAEVKILTEFIPKEIVWPAYYGPVEGSDPPANLRFQRKYMTDIVFGHNLKAKAKRWRTDGKLISTIGAICYERIISIPKGYGFVPRWLQGRHLQILCCYIQGRNYQQGQEE